MLLGALVLLGILARSGLSTPLEAPIVRLDNATVSGQSFGKVSRFLGIPFAKPP